MTNIALLCKDNDEDKDDNDDIDDGDDDDVYNNNDHCHNLFKLLL